ncbi:DMT family transporter [Nocardioides mangrovicus]|uniref:DMT family transporter n=1 Tax=Nocardioides mangrovicus TaxID=2478913 RepID=A0A3L8P7T9_9ACTN|nr:DMT family transporter [Nocardioides mangrovicus]RLV50843.1 DMT family transporter [Nocardioides mangrovicus]
MSTPGVRTLALLAVAVVAISFAGPLMAGLAVPALAVAFWRNGMATALLAPVALGPRRAELGSLGRRDVGLVVLAGALLALHFGTWVTSLRMTSVAASTAIVCFQVVWVVAYDRWRGVRLAGPASVGLVVALVGVLVITGVDLSVSVRALVGDLLALVGSVAVAAYTVVGARVRRTVSTTVYTSCCYGTAAVLLLVTCLLAGVDVVGYHPREWATLVLVTLTAQLLGHSVFNHLLQVVSPMLVSLALLLEIPGAALVAAVLLGQLPPVGVVVGLLLILAGTATVVVSARVSR